MIPAMTSVVLNAIEELLLLMPSAERLSRHQCTSLEASMLANAPTTRNTASTRESTIGVRATALRNETYPVSANATATSTAPGNA